MALHFELVSPEKLVLSQDVEMAVLPGLEGDMGILQDHMPLISVLRPGIVTLMNGGRTEERLFVEGGFVEVTRDSCIVLAEHATKIAELDETLASRQLADARADQMDAKSEAEREKAERQVQIAEARMAAFDKPAY